MTQPTPNTREEIDRDAPISFDEAARVCLRGTVKASTLRAAWERRELTAERLGRRIVTTPGAVEDWRKRCRVEARDQASTLKSDPAMSRFGISETEQSVSPQDLANASIAALLESSPNTSLGRKRLRSGKATRTR